MIYTDGLCRKMWVVGLRQKSVVKQFNLEYSHPRHKKMVPFSFYSRAKAVREVVRYHDVLLRTIMNV